MREKVKGQLTANDFINIIPEKKNTKHESSMSIIEVRIIAILGIECKILVNAERLTM